MAASSSTSLKRKSPESAPPTPQPEPHKKCKFAKPEVVDDYQVFLSFRGPDTRNDFTDVLYEHMDRVGIRVFKDDNEISVGQPIDIILQAIENSEICVPILSESFASSAWCLREVEKMVEMEKKVMPIFYKISPDDVKLKTDMYKTAMADHEAKHGKDKVEKWKTALNKISKIKGREISSTTRYTEFCKKFVSDVLSELLPRKRSDTDHLVGIDSRIENMMEVLDIGSDDRRYVVIHGMSGIGKTTLANVIFDNLSAKFDNACFLEDVRESFCRGNNGFIDLQKEFLERLDPKSVGRSNFPRGIRETFYKRKVLIVLDDVDKWEQIEKFAGRSNWFGAGSRVIITTRNKEVLNEGALDEGEVRAFEMKTLDYGEAHALFCWYAFRKHAPSAAFESFSREIVVGAGGLPLALKVTGALLYKKDGKVWRDVISRLKKTPSKEVVERLRISFDALEDDQKKIFLDIACLSSICKEKANAVYMWEACELYPHYGLEVLSCMSLVKNVDDNTVRMHDQLRDLGKKLVREESGDPAKRSRLWEHKEALKVLMSVEGKEKVEALSIDSAVDITLSRDHFASFRELRFLKMAGANIIGDFVNLLPNLRWLSWHRCPSPFKVTNFYPENLVALDFAHSFIDESWGGWNLFKILKNLKALDLSNCHSLATTPSFSENSVLEKLILHGCNALGRIDGSIRNLTSLKQFVLTDCSSLQGLPDELCLLENLEEVVVGGNYKEFALPESLGNLKRLSVLRLEDLYITDLPNSVGGLTNLQSLSIRWCRGIKKLPESVGELESLVHLDVSHTAIEELPSSIKGLTKLNSLDLTQSRRIRALPDSIGYLTSLVVLTLYGSEMTSLPESVGCLIQLERLVLSNCKIRKLPATIGTMAKLRQIRSSFTPLEEVPMEIGGLDNLVMLDLQNSCISTLPCSVDQLPNLERLHLEDNDQLRYLPQLPSSLTELHVSSASLKKVVGISNLRNLIELSFRGQDPLKFPRHYSNLEGIEKLTELLSLCLGIGEAITLPIPLGSLTQLGSLGLHFPTDPVPDNAIELPDLSNLKNLSELAFHNFSIGDGLESLGIGELEKVETLWITNCSSVLVEMCLLKGLRVLSIMQCGSVERLPDISTLKNLVTLQLVDCKALIEIRGLGRLESLEELNITRCGSLETVENLSELKSLSSIWLYKCPKLRSLQGTERVFFSDLQIKGCASFENGDELKKRARAGSINGLRFENFA